MENLKISETIDIIGEDFVRDAFKRPGGWGHILFHCRKSKIKGKDMGGDYMKFIKELKLTSSSINNIFREENEDICKNQQIFIRLGDRQIRKTKNIQR